MFVLCAVPALGAEDRVREVDKCPVVLMAEIIVLHTDEAFVGILSPIFSSKSISGGSEQHGHGCFGGLESDEGVIHLGQMSRKICGGGVLRNN